MRQLLLSIETCNKASTAEELSRVSDPVLPAAMISLKILSALSVAVSEAWVCSS
jgi:hypothetical protein